jgi:hypothetical protein
MAVEPEPIAEPAVVETSEIPDEEPQEKPVEVVEEVAQTEAPPEPPIAEVEYWWDAAPPDSNGAAEQDVDPSSGWLPEPVIHPQRW